MKLIDKFTNKELKLLSNVGITIEDKDYSKEEINDYEREITDYIMWHSSKNGDIKRLTNEYNSVLNTIIKCE
jgi:hypothetical protein